MSEDPSYLNLSPALSPDLAFDQTIDQTLDFTLLASDPEPLIEAGSLELASKTERYDLLKSLGTGAMGDVDLARDRILYRKVAYKQLKPELSRSAVFLNRFYKEAQITAQLEHPGIVPVYSLEQSSQRSLAYAMKWIRGQTLKTEIQNLHHLLTQPPLLTPVQAEAAQRRLLGIFVRLAEAVDYAHSQGAVHRDLKPDNIMVGEYGEVYVLDWGVASLKGEQAQTRVAFQKVAGQPLVHSEQTQLGKLVGTPRYMSPEQARGEPGADHASSDLYSLGLILYEICCLRPAYHASHLDQLLTKISQNDYHSPTAINERLPLSRAWRAVLAQALGPTPARRYTDVKDLLADVRAVLQDRPPAVLPDRLWQKGLRWSRRHPQATVLGMLVLLLGAASMVTGSLWLSQQALIQSQQRERALQTILTQRAMVSRSLDSYLSEMAAQLEHLSARAIEAHLHSRGLSPAERQALPEVAWLGVNAQSDPAAYPALQSLPAPLARLAQGEATDTVSPVRWSSIAYQDGPQLIYPLTAAPDFQSRFSPPASLKQDDAPHWTGLQAETLTAYRSLYAPGQRYLGWAGMGLDPGGLTERILPAELSSALPGVQAALLVDQAGQIQLQAGPAMALSPQIWQALKQRPSAYYETAGLIWVRQPLSALPWQLVWAIDWQTLVEAQDVSLP